MADSTKSAPALFSTFVMGMASAALIEMGVVKDPQNSSATPNRAAARQHIDFLAMIQEKTRGNLSPEEKELLDRALQDLRLQFARLK